jgi:hypothetical protein
MGDREVDNILRPSLYSLSESRHVVPVGLVLVFIAERGGDGSLLTQFNNPSLVLFVVDIHERGVVHN